MAWEKNNMFTGGKGNRTERSCPKFPTLYIISCIFHYEFPGSPREKGNNLICIAL